MARLMPVCPASGPWHVDYLKNRFHPYVNSSLHHIDHTFLRLPAGLLPHHHCRRLECYENHHFDSHGHLAHLAEEYPHRLDQTAGSIR